MQIYVGFSLKFNIKQENAKSKGNIQGGIIFRRVGTRLKRFGRPAAQCEGKKQGKYFGGYKKNNPERSGLFRAI